jgi:hypothetical protein
MIATSRASSLPFPASSSIADGSTSVSRRAFAGLVFAFVGGTPWVFAAALLAFDVDALDVDAVAADVDAVDADELAGDAFDDDAVGVDPLDVEAFDFENFGVDAFGDDAAFDDVVFDDAAFTDAFGRASFDATTFDTALADTSSGGGIGIDTGALGSGPESRVSMYAAPITPAMTPTIASLLTSASLTPATVAPPPTAEAIFARMRSAVTPSGERPSRAASSNARALGLSSVMA